MNIMALHMKDGFHTVMAMAISSNWSQMGLYIL